MSFVERNKLWLLPLLGLGVVGVVALNLKTFRKKPVPTAPSAPPIPGAEAQAAPAPSAPVPPPMSMPMPMPAPLGGAPSGPGDLWTDLRRLEAPAPALNDLAALMSIAEKPLTPEPEPRPDLHPETWTRLPTVAVAPVPTNPSPSAPASLQPLDFILRSPNGRWAYFGGRPFAEGQSPDGHHRILTIQARRVTLRSADGRVRTLTTDLSLPLAALPEAP